MNNPLEYSNNTLTYNLEDMEDSIPYCILADDKIIVMMKKRGRILSYYIQEKFLKEKT